MVLRQMWGLPALGLRLAASAPSRVAESAGPAAETTLRAAAEAASLGRRGAARAAAAASAAVGTVTRVGRGAISGEPGHWRAGDRWHLPLASAEGSHVRGRAAVAAAARAVAAEVAAHPDVVFAYWDEGLGRIVLRLGEAAVEGRVAETVDAVAARHGLTRRLERPEPLAHPGEAGAVRQAAAALALDALGLGAALAGKALPGRRLSRPLVAVATVLREDPRAFDLARAALGRGGADLAVAGMQAVGHGLGGSPVALALDGALRTSQLVEAVLRLAAFDAGHDWLCAPERVSVGDGPPRRRRQSVPVEDYAGAAVTGSALAAGASLLFQRDAAAAADAVLAGSPKAARMGAAAFAAGLGCALARHGVLVRDPDRLRLLESVDTLVLHPSALRGERRVVLHVRPTAGGWDRARLWQEAVAALHGEPAAVRLRPVEDTGSAEAGVMRAAADGQDVGVVHVGWEPDPYVEAVLDASRRTGLRVLLAADPSLEDFTALADEVVGAGTPLPEVLGRLRAQGRVTLTVARLDDADQAVRDGLLASDLAVAVVSDRSAVLWTADVLPLRGLVGVWRLLSAVHAARSVTRQSKVLAEAGAALSGLLMVTGASGRGWRHPLAYRLRLSPVDVAAAAALLAGWRSAAGVGWASPPAPRPRVRWHALAPRQALARLRRVSEEPSALSALSAQVARTTRRAWRHPAAVGVRAPAHLIGAVGAELHDPLTPVLAVGAAASAILGSSVDAMLVSGAMGLNALVGGAQRLRAERALAALAVAQRRHARRVSRQGQVTIVDAAALAPGDVVRLEVGDVIPADARLLEVADLEVDESSLTGESLPVAKQVAATPDAGLADRRCMVFEGATVVAGHGQALVVNTGEQTEAGRAVALATHTPPAAGVQARLQELTSRALPLTLGGGAAVAGLALLRGRSIRQAVSGGVAVAVAAVPEGLPLVATAAQLAAARRLSTRGLLVRTPRTLEALGRVDSVCFDKTGTLTQNKLRVVWATDPSGQRQPPEAPASAAILRHAARACPREHGEAKRHAHATDEAVLTAAPPGDGWRQLDGQPFEASRGYAAAIGIDADGQRLLVVKGAPEVVTSACSNAPEHVQDVFDDLAGEGLRVLAVARRRLGPGTGDAAADQPLADLELLGFLALADTPRSTARELVGQLRAAGVEPVMLTGDHPRTARAIALELGWPPETTVVTGDELAALDHVGRTRALRRARVVARVAPEQKLQVVEALRAAGRVVAMVGDGANDAAAIRAADVGIGIASRGSAAARNAADVVVTRDDDLTALAEAVAEGRALWRSVADAVGILIGGNAGEVGFTVLGTLLAGTPPLSARQLLLVNLLTDLFPAMAVAVTPNDEPVGAGGDASVGGSALRGPLTRNIRRRGIITGLAATTAWTIGTITPGSARRTSTMSLCGLVGAQLAQTVIGREHRPLVLATAAGSAVALAAVVQTPVVSHFFGCAPLGPVAWSGVAVAIAGSVVGYRVLPSVEQTLGSLARQWGVPLPGMG